jgi:hypothetical protein
MYHTTQDKLIEVVYMYIMIKHFLQKAFVQGPKYQNVKPIDSTK